MGNSRSISHPQPIQQPNQRTVYDTSKRDKRIRAEAQLCASLTLEADGVCVDIESAVPERCWTAYVQGPLSTPWENAVFQLELTFPAAYPWNPLSIRFTHCIFHPNVSPEDGTLCDRLGSDQWSPAFRVPLMLMRTRALLSCPNSSAMDAGIVGGEEAALKADESIRTAIGLYMPQKLYHYTDRQSMASIEQSRVLRESTSGIAGNGVYATTLHPSNCSKAEIDRNNWGGGIFNVSRCAYVIELDVSALESQGFRSNRVTENRNIFLITRIGGPSSIPLDASNSSLAPFEKLATCHWNKVAGTLMTDRPDEYWALVSDTVRKFGNELVHVRRQSLAA